jgi:hypothetical protein
VISVLVAAATGTTTWTTGGNRERGGTELSDEQLRNILAGSDGCAAINPMEAIMWLSANLQSVLGLVGDPAQGELLKKIVAGFDLAPIK